MIVRAAVVCDGSDWPRRQARVCCVSRLFEALAFDTLGKATVNVNFPSTETAPRRIWGVALSSELRALHLSSFGQHSPAAVAAAVAALPLCTALKTLRIHLFQSAPELGAAVARCTVLTSLSYFSGRADWLSAALPLLRNLVELDLGVYLQDSFPAALLQSSVTCLTCEEESRAPFSWLDLAACVSKLEVNHGTWAPWRLAAADPDLDGLQELRVLDFGGAVLAPPALQPRLARLLPATLRVLMLHCRWGAAADLAAGLAALISLTRLTLPETDMAVVLPALPRCVALQWLSLNIDDAVAAAAARVLPLCTALTKLELDRTFGYLLQEHRFTPVLAALNRCAGVRVLSFMAVSGVEDEDTLVRCCEAVIHHPSLTKLMLGDGASADCRARCEAVCRAGMPQVDLCFYWDDTEYWGYIL